MKRLITSLLALTTLIAVAQADDKLEGVREKVSSMFDMIDAEDVTASPVDGWYTIQKGAIVAYVSEDGRYMLQGDLIDLDANRNLSEAARDESRKQMMSELPDNRVIAFSPAEKKYTVSIFTDIECTYCRRLHNQIQDYLDEGIEVRYLLYPRNGPASRSWSTSEDVWCAKDRQSALTNAKLDRPFESNKCDASIVQDHYVLGQEVGLSGTPAIVLEDGELIGGYLPAMALKQRLDQKALAN